MTSVFLSDDKILLLTVPRCNRIPSPATAKLRDTVIQTIIGKWAGKDLENYQVWTSMTCKTAQKAMLNLFLKTISGENSSLSRQSNPHSTVYHCKASTTSDLHLSWCYLRWLVLVLCTEKVENQLHPFYLHQDLLLVLPFYIFENFLSIPLF